MKISRKRANAAIEARIAAPAKARRRRVKRAKDWQRASQLELLPYRHQRAPQL